MAKRRVIWTKTAITERKEILTSWINRIKSKTYSQKLNKRFWEAVLILSDYPQIVRATVDKGVRLKVVRDYLIFYEFNKKELIVLSIWDTRRAEGDIDYTYT